MKRIDYTGDAVTICEFLNDHISDWTYEELADPNWFAAYLDDVQAAFNDFPEAPEEAEQC